jgi:RNA polymerase sigma factor (sigma-70 family)
MDTVAAVRPLERASGIEPFVRDPCDERARELFERHERRITSFCRWRLGSWEEAEDAAQTTFLHAFGALRRGVVPVAEVPWLLAIAKNVCLTRLDSTRRREGVEVTRDPGVLAESSASREAAADDLFGLEDALKVLPEQQRRAILLREWKGLSYREIADDLGLSLAAVETLIFRARRGLAERLSEGLAPARKRLAGLLDAGALLSGLKSIVGGAAAVKAAACVVAVTGVVVVAGSSLVDPSSSPPRDRHESRPAATATLASRPASPDVADAPLRPAPGTATRPADGQPGGTGPRGTKNTGPATAAAPAVDGVGAGAVNGGPPLVGTPNIPSVKPPPVATPGVDLPDVQLPGETLPDVKPPEVKVPDLPVPLPTGPTATPPPALPPIELPALP